MICKRSIIAASMMATLATALPAAGEDGAQPSPVVIVLDGSGSMWGNLDGGTSKLVAAREALRQALPELDGRMRLGIISFGGSCTTTEQVLAPEPASATQMQRSLERFNPRGKGPLTLGLQEAAKAAGPASTLVLVHDGPDNCQQDPCAEITTLARTYPGLKVHVLSLALERPDFQAISCVPRATGGRHFDIKDPGGLEKALATVFRLTNQGPSRPIAAEPSQNAASAEPQRRADGPPGLSVTASLAQGGPALTEMVHWTLLKPDSSELMRHIGPNLRAELAAGSYIVEARAGLAAARSEIEVADRGLTASRIALNAGRLAIVAGGETTGADAGEALITVSEVRAGDTSSTGDRLPLWFTRQPAPNLIVPAGTYRVGAEAGRAQVFRTISVSPGKVAAVDLQLGTGRLELVAISHTQGLPLDKVLYMVGVDDPDKPGGRREVARTAAPTPVFHLTPGTYHVTARVGATEVRDRVAIGAGDIVRRTLVVPSGRLSVAVTVNGREPSDDRQLMINVSQPPPTPGRIARSSRLHSEFVLGQGKYVVTAEFGSQNVRSTAEVTLAPGEMRDLALRLEAATLRLRHRGLVSAGHADTLCETRDERGKVVWRTNQREAFAELAPGRYSVRCGQRDRPLEKIFSLAAGEQREIDLPHE